MTCSADLAKNCAVLALPRLVNSLSLKVARKLSMQSVRNDRAHKTKVYPVTAAITFVNRTPCWASSMRASILTFYRLKMYPIFSSVLVGIEFPKDGEQPLPASLQAPEHNQSCSLEQFVA